jgi:predicted aspartyl protease
MVNVIIEGKVSVGGPALIDSGATNTFVPYGLADAIGIIPEKKDKVKKSSTMGASGRFETSILRLKRLHVFKDNHVFETFQDLFVYVSDNVNDPYLT